MRIGPNAGNLLAPLLCLAAAPGASAGTPPSNSVATPATALAPSPESVAAQRFTDWLAAFNAADRAALLACHQRYFAFEDASAAVAGTERDLRLGRQLGGLEPLRREEVTPTRVVVILKARQSESYARAVLEVEAGQPQRVARFELRPIPTPDDLLPPGAPGRAPLDAANRRRVIDGIAREMRAHYVFPEVAEKAIAALEGAAAHGAFDRLDRGPAFADAVGKLLREVSHDGHLRFFFGPMPTPPPPAGAGLQQARLQSVKDLNYGFGSIERLDGNIARLTIYEFPPTDLVREPVGQLMTQVADAAALIVDLRYNHGGSPPTVALVASYLFEPTPVHLNDMFRRDNGSTTESWTLRDVPGQRFGGRKPVYLLTSKRTFSGGEELAYDLKCLRRALLIGETTGGGANPAGPPADLGGGFRILVPWGRPINPITKTNWEGVGVQPDVSVPADQALAEAHRRALSDLATAAKPKP